MKGKFWWYSAFTAIPLYPTWFRWKISFESFVRITLLFFISHMVQMKGKEVKITGLKFRTLYIPHGSDERSQDNQQQQVCNHFISHMVQMKETLNKCLCLKWFYFISHMVQMKARCLRLPKPEWVPLYPTWFRWKIFHIKAWSCLCNLYIPHGSDESSASKSSSGFLLDFISHMVQMKGATAGSTAVNIGDFISHMVQMKVTYNRCMCMKVVALYPTWFRWKPCRISLQNMMMVTLYPTWFRWKHLLTDNEA